MVNDKSVYNYNYGNGCKIQEVLDDGMVTDWESVCIGLIMVD